MAEDDSTPNKRAYNIFAGATGKTPLQSYPAKESHASALKKITAKKNKFLQPSEPTDNPNRRM